MRASTGRMGVCDLPEPTTGLEGKFSLRATAAMALLGDDTSDPAAFTDARMRDPAFLKMRDRVTFVPTPGLSTTCATVVVRAGGRELAAEADTGTPEADVARQSERLRDKFLALTSPVVGAARAASLAVALERVDDAPSMRDIVALAPSALPVAAR